MLDTFSIFASTYLWYAIIGIAIVYFLMQSRPRQKRMLIFAALVLPLVYIVSIIGGAFYDDPRPFVVGHFSPLLPHKPNNGVPSHHVLCGAATSELIFSSTR